MWIVLTCTCTCVLDYFNIASTRDNDTMKTKRHRTVNSDGCDYYKLNNIETMRDLALVRNYYLLLLSLSFG